MYLISRIAGKASIPRLFLFNKRFHRWNQFHNFLENSPAVCHGHAKRWFSVDMDKERATLETSEDPKAFNGNTFHFYKLGFTVLGEDAEEVFKAVTKNRKDSASNEEKGQDPGQLIGAGDMIQLNNFKKYLLRMSGRWKKFSDIPDVLSESRYNSDLWVTRIRIASIMMILWVITAILTSLWGKQARTERTHQLVLKQYWDSLSDEEKEEFIKEYNINPETIK